MNNITMTLQVDHLILEALKEDISSEDVTTNSVMKEAVPGEVDLICKQSGVIAGLLLHWFPGAGNRYTLTPPPGGWAELLVEKGLPRAFSLSD